MEVQLLILIAFNCLTFRHFLEFLINYYRKVVKSKCIKHKQEYKNEKLCLNSKLSYCYICIYMSLYLQEVNIATTARENLGELQGFSLKTDHIINCPVTTLSLTPSPEQIWENLFLSVLKAGN